MRVWPGQPYPLGATWDGEGVNFAIFSENATGMELCLFDEPLGAKESFVIPVRERTHGIWHVYLPASMPMILTGLRQGLGLCWFVIIAAEMLPGAESGIGYLLIYASDNAAMDIVIAAMLIVGSIGAFLSLMMRRIMSGLVRWHGKEI